MTNGWGILCEIAIRWMSLNLTDDKSTLVQVMAWCRHSRPSGSKPFTWTNVDLDLCHHMASLGCEDLIYLCIFSWILINIDLVKFHLISDLGSVYKTQSKRSFLFWVRCTLDILSPFLSNEAGIILCMHPANERWCYIVMLSLIGWRIHKMIPDEVTKDTL